MKLKNPKSVTLSLIALVCLIAAFTVHWYFLLPAALLSYYGWKELMK